MWLFVAISSLAVMAVALIYFLTWHPVPLETVKIRASGSAPQLESGQSVKILSYNVQYMAGKGYVFFYDLPGDAGPDNRPSPEAISNTISEVARIINEEQPDIVLLQEVNDGAKRTDYEDQLARLLPLLSPVYPYHASAFYWKNRFVPHPHIMGATGMKLSTLSRFQITSAVRHQLPLRTNDILRRQFNFKRAVLETRLAISDGGELVVFNTHLDAFAHNTDTMKRQVGKLIEILSVVDAETHPWIIGGDFNLLPPGHTWDGPLPSDSSHRTGQTDIFPLYEKYAAFPSLDDISGPSYRDFYTQFPNNPAFKAPNKTIDYFFFPHTLTIDSAYVRQQDTWTISDHLPLLLQLRLP